MLIMFVASGVRNPEYSSEDVGEDERRGGVNPISNAKQSKMLHNLFFIFLFTPFLQIFLAGRYFSFWGNFSPLPPAGSSHPD
jgi:hypothetical protein